MLEAHVERAESEAKIRRAEVYSLASLIGVAINNPKNFPKPGDYIGGKRARRFSTDAELQLWAMSHAQAAGKARKKGRA